MPRPAWINLQQVMVTMNQHQCSQYNPAVSSEQSQFSPVVQTAMPLGLLVNLCQGTKSRPPALFSSPAPPSHGTLGSKQQ